MSDISDGQTKIQDAIKMENQQNYHPQFGIVAKTPVRRFRNGTLDNNDGAISLRNFIT